MKYMIAIVLAGILFTSNAQQHSLEKMWETDSIVAVPESVLPQPDKNILYVSLIDGGGWDADAKGGVAKLTPDGKRYDSTWVTGLNAPKGMGIYGNRLFVADINVVAVVNIANGKVEKKISIDSAMGLNDITVDSKGTVYVSDSKTGKIWRIENDQPQLFLSGLNGVNGLKSIGNDLFIGAGKLFLKADQKKEVTKIAELPESIDGIEPVGNGDFILTAWVGYIYYVSGSGNIQVLLDTHLQKKNTADIGYDPSKRIVYVPTFNARKVVAYALK
jgi:hypothetical protein